MDIDDPTGERRGRRHPHEHWVSGATADGSDLEVPDRPSEDKFDDWSDEGKATPVHEQEVRPDEVEFALEWISSGRSSQHGTLIARNVSEREWRLTGVPELTLFGENGDELDVIQLGHPIGTGPARVEPGGTATSSVSWTWDGTPVARRLGIRWAGGFAAVVPTGPLHPSERYRGASITASAFIASS